jgi:hypothetical protein
MEFKVRGHDTTEPGGILTERNNSPSSGDGELSPCAQGPAAAIFSAAKVDR